jgi:hypothetical protein
MPSSCRIALLEEKLPVEKDGLLLSWVAARQRPLAHPRVVATESGGPLRRLVPRVKPYPNRRFYGTVTGSADLLRASDAVLSSCFYETSKGKNVDVKARSDEICLMPSPCEWVGPLGLKFSSMPEASYPRASASRQPGTCILASPMSAASSAPSHKLRKNVHSMCTTTF